MKGFIVLLKPKDASGVQRNEEYLQKTKGLLSEGGVAELLPDGSLRCSWIFPGLVPDPVKRTFVKHFTKGLDDAIKVKDNITYEVKMI